MAHVLANDLRAAVLQAAIQGKLTSKDKNDSLINETQKEYQIPFADGYDLELDIPDYWRFCTIQNVCETIKAGGDKPKTFSKEKTKNNSIPVIANGETNNGVIGYTDEAVIFQKSLTVSGRGTIGFSVIRDTPYYPIVRLLVLIPKQFINIKYLKIAMTALLETGVGTAVKQLTKPMISQKVIPLPPIEEQQRIVDRVDELMAKIDEYEKLENQLVQLKEQFPKDMRDSLLQAGMMGKLTEHLESDTPVNIPVVANNTDAYFGEIPDTWKYVHLGNVFNIRSASRVHKADWRNRGVPFYRAREVVKLAQNGSVENELYIDEELYEKFAKSSGVPKVGDLLVSGVGTLGATYIVKETDRFYYKDASVLCFENINNQNSNFAKYLLNTPYVIKQIYDQSAFGTTVATLTMKRANVFVVALPPLEEQQRIVDKLDELLPLVDSLAQMD